MQGPFVGFGAFVGHRFEKIASSIPRVYINTVKMPIDKLQHASEEVLLLDLVILHYSAYRVASASDVPCPAPHGGPLDGGGMNQGYGDGSVRSIPMAEVNTSYHCPYDGDRDVVYLFRSTPEARLNRGGYPFRNNADSGPITLGWYGFTNAHTRSWPGWFTQPY